MSSSYTVPRIVVLIFCLTFFTKVVVDQFLIYYSQDTNTAVSYTTEKEMKFPVLAFCPNSITKDKNISVNSLSLTASNYSETMVRLGVKLQSVGLNQFHPLENVPYDQEELYTAYNGICDVFIIREPVEPLAKIRFK